MANFLMKSLSQYCDIKINDIRITYCLDADEDIPWLHSLTSLRSQHLLMLNDRSYLDFLYESYFVGCGTHEIREEYKKSHPNQSSYQIESAVNQIPEYRARSRIWDFRDKVERTPLTHAGCVEAAIYGNRLLEEFRKQFPE